MIDLLRTYYEDKSKIEKIIVEGDLFEEVNMPTNLKTGQQSYPITAAKDGILMSIDEYHSFAISKIFIVHNNKAKKGERIKYFENIKFSQLNKTVKYLHEFLPYYGQNKVSRIDLVFFIPTEIQAKEIIKTNILKHKSKDYNHNKNLKKGIELKEFDYENYKIGFYATKKGDDRFTLKVLLSMKKSAEFKVLNIKKPLDILTKEILTLLFSIFMKRFKEVVIVDSYNNVEEKNITEKDSLQLKQFLNNRYWSDLSERYSRTTVSKKRILFKSLIMKYNLDTIKLKFIRELEKKFKEFINN
jgi:hypothetical protein